MKIKNSLKPVMLIVVSLLTIFIAYYLKCQEGINLIPSFSLSRVAPFNYLQNVESTVYANDGKVIISDNFDGLVPQSKWDKLWAREEKLVLEEVRALGRERSKCIVVKSSSDKDWSVQNSSLVEVRPGYVFYYEGYLKSSGISNKAGFSVILYDDFKQVIQWVYAYKGISGDAGWTKVEAKFLIPMGVKYIRFRLIGEGKGESFADDIILKKDESEYSTKGLKGEYVINNGLCSFTINAIKNEAVLLDKNTGSSWVMPGFFGKLFLRSVNEKSDNEVNVEAIGSEDLSAYSIDIKTQDQEKNVSIEINRNENTGFEGLEFPVFEVSDANVSFVLPLAQGMIIPVNDLAGSYFSFLSSRPLPFVGLTRGDAGLLIMDDKPVDSEIIIDGNSAGKVWFKTRWLSEKGDFGYSRKMSLYLIDKAGCSGIAKEARRILTSNGYLKTLKEKNKARNDNIDKLLGAVDVWYWGFGPRQFINDASKVGITKMLYSRADWRADIDYINKIGYLSSQYDIYQDVWPPIYHEVTKNHEGWPDALVLNKKGDWIKGWVIKKGLKEYPGGVICSVEGFKMAKKKLPEDLKNKPHMARFIDTTTSTPWRECYSKAHPTTRTEDMKNKMGLLNFYSNDMHLVTGSEDGVYTAVPYCDYFEGMMSPWIGRLPDSGRNVIGKRYSEPTENFLKYQVGTKYRIPLWELVFHDCAVTTWYWGDSSNLISEVWYKRDLFNILYGNMPLWSIPDWDYWVKHRDRFIECYKNVCPVFEKVGYAEMLTHRFVTDDHNVQETTFSNDVRIVVNFGVAAYKFNDGGYLLPAHGFVVFENGKIWKEGVCS